MKLELFFDWSHWLFIILMNAIFFGILSILNLLPLSFSTILMPCFGFFMWCTARFVMEDLSKQKQNKKHRYKIITMQDIEYGEIDDGNTDIAVIHAFISIVIFAAIFHQHIVDKVGSLHCWIIIGACILGYASGKVIKKFENKEDDNT